MGHAAMVFDQIYIYLLSQWPLQTSPAPIAAMAQPRSAGRDAGHPASKTDDHDAEDPEPMTR